MIALVTGANRGLGLETCRQLEARGWRVLAAARKGTPYALDVTDEESIAELAQRLEREGVVLDVLVNNAGVANGGWEHVLAVNFFGPLNVTRALLPRLAPKGHVVMVSSGLGELSAQPANVRAKLADPSRLSSDALAELMPALGKAGGWSGYGVTKAGLNAMTRILARELAPRRVNAVCPGWVRTDMGGAGAPRSIEEGGASIVAAATLEGEATGRCWRDGAEVDW